jgi:hypothetical protein
VTRSSWVRAAAVTLITATITLAAACSDQDTVDTNPPPWPTRTTTPDGPPRPPSQPTSTTPASTSTVTQAGTT